MSTLASLWQEFLVRASRRLVQKLYTCICVCQLGSVMCMFLGVCTIFLQTLLPGGRANAQAYMHNTITLNMWPLQGLNPVPTPLLV